ncbi:MAG: MFS transporter [Gammaproteobacteria bacterium]|nr:MFS transporter [Gammaproteobacteria bacterium]
MLNKSQLLLLQFIIFMAFLAMTLPYPLIAPLFLSMPSSSIFIGLSKQMQISLILGIYPLGLFAGGLLLGHLADLYNKKKVLLYSLFFAACMQCLSGYLVTKQYYNGLLITRFLSGIGEGNIAIARSMLAIICSTEQTKRLHFGRSNAALTLGWTIGPLLGAVFSDQSYCFFFNFSTPFYVGSCLTFLTFILVFLKLNMPRLNDLPTIPSSSLTSSSSLSTKNNFLLILSCSLLMTLGIDAFYQFLPVYLAASFHYSPMILGSAVSIVALTNTLGNLLFIPFVSKFISTVSAIIIFPFLLSICLLLISTNHYQWFIFLVLPIIGILIALTMTNLTVYLSMQTTFSKQGKLMGILLSQRTLGTAVISFCMAPLLIFGYQIPFIVGSLLLLLATGLIVAISQQREG